MISRWISKLNIFVEGKSRVGNQPLPGAQPLCSTLLVDLRRPVQKTSWRGTWARKSPDKELGQWLVRFPNPLCHLWNLVNDRRLERLTWLAPSSRGTLLRKPEAQEQGSVRRQVQIANTVSNSYKTHCRSAFKSESQTAEKLTSTSWVSQKHIPILSGL